MKIVEKIIRNNVIKIYNTKPYVNYYMTSKGFTIQFDDEPDANAYLSFKNFRNEGARFPASFAALFELENKKRILLNFDEETRTYSYTACNVDNMDLYTSKHSRFLPEMNIPAENKLTKLSCQAKLDSTSLTLQFVNDEPAIKGQVLVKVQTGSRNYFTIEHFKTESIYPIGPTKSIYGTRFQYYPFSTMQFTYQNIHSVKLPVNTLYSMDIYEDTLLDVYMDKTGKIYIAHEDYKDIITGNTISSLFNDLEDVFIKDTTDNRYNIIYAQIKGEM